MERKDSNANDFEISNMWQENGAIMAKQKKETTLKTKQTNKRNCRRSRNERYALNKITNKQGNLSCGKCLNKILGVQKSKID